MMSNYVTQIQNTLKWNDQQLVRSWLSAETTNANVIERLRPDVYPHSTKRYRFVTDNDHFAATLIFEKAFHDNPEAVIRATESLERPTVKKWVGRVIQIHLPKMIHKISSNRLLQLAVFVMATYVTYQTGLAFTNLAKECIISRCVPYVLSHAPTVLTSKASVAVRCFNFIQANKKNILGVFAAVTLLPLVLPKTVSEKMEKVVPVALIGAIVAAQYGVPLSLVVFLTAIPVGQKALTGFLQVPPFFKQLHQKGLCDRQERVKAKAKNLWLKSVREVRAGNRSGMDRSVIGFDPKQDRLVG